MKKQLLILGAALSFFVMACTGQPDSATDADASASSKTAGGGSAAHIDSLKTMGTGVNGKSSDTSKLGNAATYPATDTVKKQKP
jgi:hypothetical protein